jgi:Zn-finger nucleic acid-binding protein
LTIENIEKRSYEEASSDSRGMKCPSCLATMQEVRRYEVDIDYCPSCKGVWLDRGEINRIATIQNRFNEEHYHHYHEDRDYDDYDDDYYHYRTHRKGKKRGFFGDLFDFD